MAIEGLPERGPSKGIIVPAAIILKAQLPDLHGLVAVAVHIDPEVHGGCASASVVLLDGLQRIHCAAASGADATAGPAAAIGPPMSPRGTAGISAVLAAREWVFVGEFVMDIVLVLLLGGANL